jgi:hypothetical protein
MSEIKPSVNLNKKDRDILSDLAERDQIDGEIYPRLDSSAVRDYIATTLYLEHPINMKKYLRKNKNLNPKSKRKCRCKK